MPAEDHLPQNRRDALRGRSVCVTGGAGFIGGHLTEALLRLGARVAVIDDLSNAGFDLPAALLDRWSENFRFVHASILERRALAEAVEGADVVFHLAAMSSVPRSVEEPERSFEVNAAGTVRVLEAARAAGVRRLVYSASSSAYGDAPTLPKVETMRPDPLSPYAAGKLAGEEAVAAWSRCYPLEGISLRYFNIFGPRQPADSPYSGVVAAFARRLLSGQRPVIHGDGEQTRDFTYVDNAVLANLLAATAIPHPGELRGQVVNVGSGERISINDLARLMAEAAGRPDLAPEHLPPRAGDVRDSLADIAAAELLLGYRPLATLRQGLEPTLAWYREQYAAA